MLEHWYKEKRTLVDLPNTTDSLFAYSPTPQCGRAPLYFQLSSDLLIGSSLSGTEDNPGSKHDLLRR